jgi:hypothetical protein
MTETMLVTIAGEAVSVPAVMNFTALKRAWTSITALGEAADPVAQIEAAIGIVAAALAKVRPDLTADVIGERLKGPEMIGLLGAVPALLAASGLVPAGEAQPGIAPAGQMPSTSTASSPV